MVERLKFPPRERCSACNSPLGQPRQRCTMRRGHRGWHIYGPLRMSGPLKKRRFSVAKIASDEKKLVQALTLAEEGYAANKRRLKLAMTNMEKWQKRIRKISEELAVKRGQKMPKWTEEL